jgi:hypothetical protein
MYVTRNSESVGDDGGYLKILALVSRDERRGWKTVDLGR